MNAPTNAALRLLAYATITISAVSITWLTAKERIAAQETTALLSQFRDITPGLDADDSFLANRETVTIAGTAGERYNADDGSTYYRTHTDKGYNGNITLLIGIAPDHKTLLGVRVLEHKETPGLGDKIETRISPWIHSFAGKSLDDTRFAVKKDGGDIDSFTGATITPRAIANQVDTTLRAVRDGTVQSAR